MSAVLRDVGAITLFVEDLQRSKDFYATVFDLPVEFEDANSAVFDVGNTLINLLAIPAARELIAPATVARGDVGARAQFTIWVEDTDEACADLHARGVTLLNGPTDRAWGVRTASFADPAGHIWEVAQQLPRSESLPGSAD